MWRLQINSSGPGFGVPVVSVMIIRVVAAHRTLSRINLNCKVLSFISKTGWPWFLPAPLQTNVFAVLLFLSPCSYGIHLQRCHYIYHLIQQVSESAVGEQWVQGWFAHEWCLWMRVCYRGRLSLHSRARKVCSPLPPLQRPGEILRHKGPSGNLFSTDA